MFEAGTEFKIELTEPMMNGEALYRHERSKRRSR